VLMLLRKSLTSFLQLREDRLYSDFNASDDLFCYPSGAVTSSERRLNKKGEAEVFLIACEPYVDIYVLAVYGVYWQIKFQVDDLAEPFQFNT
jgi:hypothetical protein